MGVFRLACQNTRLFIKRRTFLFILLLIGFACANFFSLYLMTSTLGDLRNLWTKIDSEQIIWIDCSADKPRIDQNSIMKQFEEAGCSFGSSFFYSAPKEVVSGEGLHSVDDLFLVLVDYIDKEIIENQYNIKSGRYLSEEDLSSSGDSCCISSQLFDFSSVLNPVGTSVVLNSKPVTVVGILSDSTYEVPNLYGSAAYIAMPSSNIDASVFPLYYIELKTPATITDEKKDEIDAIVNHFAPNANIEWPTKLNETTLWENSLYNIIINLLIIALALTNVLTVLMAWIQMNRVNLYATYVAGASKGVLYLFVAFNALVVDILSLPFAYLLYLLTATLRVWGEMIYEPSFAEKTMILICVAMLLVGITLIRSRSIIRHIEGQKGKI